MYEIIPATELRISLGVLVAEGTFRKENVREILIFLGIFKEVLPETSRVLIPILYNFLVEDSKLYAGRVILKDISPEWPLWEALDRAISISHIWTKEEQEEIIKRLRQKGKIR